jgi:hypothetical protein
MLTDKTMIIFIGELDYDWPHTNWHHQIGIMSINGWCPIKRVVTKQVGQNIIITLCVTNISKVEEWCNDDDGKEAPNDSDYHESQLQNTNPTTNSVSTFKIIRASQSCIV